MTNAFLKGHVMNGNRGTLMVLKRLLTMALGALGLGALATGTAFGQRATGNIPAPDLFNDQITCSMNVPPAMNPTPTQLRGKDAEADDKSDLDAAIGMGAMDDR